MCEYFVRILTTTCAQESVCHEILGDEGQAKYGQQRLWASVGWGGMAVVAGVLIDMDSRWNTHSYVVARGINAITMG